jgi:predicted Rossmann-fold nucleotide-binding protein
MTQKDLKDRRFYKAQQEAKFAKDLTPQTPQTQSKSYKLAFQDNEFLLREELRPVRFQLELLKPEMLLDEAKVASTLVVYGSARIPQPEKADALIAAATDDRSRTIAERLKANSHYYDEARKLGQLASSCGMKDEHGNRHFVVCSGGGPSIMEAANRGARDVGADTIGLNIVLPHEQAPNEYVTPDLSFQFHYFALRKMHFLLRARAVAVFPRRLWHVRRIFRTADACPDRQDRADAHPAVRQILLGAVVNFEELMLEGVISPKDLDLFQFVETAEEAWREISIFYELEDCD